MGDKHAVVRQGWLKGSALNFYKHMVQCRSILPHDGPLHIEQRAASICQNLSCHTPSTLTLHELLDTFYFQFNSTKLSYIEHCLLLDDTSMCSMLSKQVDQELQSNEENELYVVTDLSSVHQLFDQFLAMLVGNFDICFTNPDKDMAPGLQVITRQHPIDALGPIHKGVVVSPKMNSTTKHQHPRASLIPVRSPVKPTKTS